MYRGLFKMIQARTACIVDSALPLAAAAATMIGAAAITQRLPLKSSASAIARRMMKPRRQFVKCARLPI
jgi:hypothetical protein